MSAAISHDDGNHRPPLSPDAVQWKSHYEEAIADGSVRHMPTVDEQFESIRKDILRNAT